MMEDIASISFLSMLNESVPESQNDIVVGDAVAE